MKKKAILIRIVLWNMSNVLVTKLRHIFALLLGNL
jgi:hypothetical protein